MALSTGGLKPYISVVLAQKRAGVATAAFEKKVLDQVLAAIGVQAAGPKVEQERSTATTVDGLRSIAARYSEERRPSWSLLPGVVDLLNQVVVVSRHEELVAVHLSDSGAKAAVVAGLRRAPATDDLAALIGPVPAGRLNEAFVQGETRTLWLGGTHRRSTVKADSKVLAGIDLRDTLDPSADQSYYFSAARARPDGLDEPRTVGVAPTRSTMWISSTTDWSEYRKVIRAVLAHLHATTGSQDSPLPVLATPMADATGVCDAFDMALEPPETLAEGGDDIEARQEWERWAYETVFDVTGDPDGANLEADVLHGGETLGRIALTLDTTRPDRVTVDPTAVTVAPGKDTEVADLLAKIRRNGWVKVYYDSGHTIAEQRLFSMRRRPVSFAGWEWRAFSDWVNLAKEKPDPFNAGWTGGDDSLFDWVLRDWELTEKGWLVCDDGAGEIADFIHLDVEGAHPTLTLVHVKAAKSGAAARRTSVGRYDLVASQAVKNVRYLDRLVAADGLATAAGSLVKDMVWLDRVKRPRQDLLDVVAGLGDDHARRVVIVQPHQRRTVYEKPNKSTAEQLRVEQLNDVLLAADAYCHGVQAALSVVSDGS